jgi:hypothetical protein
VGPEVVADEFNGQVEPFVDRDCQAPAVAAQALRPAVAIEVRKVM